MIATLIKLLASALIGSDLFARILATVVRWEDSKLEGAKKRQGVLDELEVVGITLAKHLQNLGVELAVAWLKTKAK